MNLQFCLANDTRTSRVTILIPSISSEELTEKKIGTEQRDSRHKYNIDFANCFFSRYQFFLFVYNICVSLQFLSYMCDVKRNGANKNNNNNTKIITIIIIIIIRIIISHLLVR